MIVRWVTQLFLNVLCMLTPCTWKQAALFFRNIWECFPKSFYTSLAMWKCASFYPENNGLDLAEITMMKELCLTVVPLGCSHLVFQIHLSSILWKGCAFPPGNSSSKDCCSFLSLSFTDNWKASIDVGTSTAAVDLFSLTAGGNALISKETNFH